MDENAAAEKVISSEAQQQEEEMDETENEQNDTSDDEMKNETANASKKHTALLRIDLESDEKAQIICRTLAVDKEPSRSTAKRTYSVEGHYLIVEITSSDAKYLQKSIDNLFDMCFLAKQTIEEVSSYRLKMTNDVEDAATFGSRTEKKSINDKS